MGNCKALWFQYLEVWKKHQIPIVANFTSQYPIKKVVKPVKDRAGQPRDALHASQRNASQLSLMLIQEEADEFDERPTELKTLVEAEEPSSDTKVQGVEESELYKDPIGIQHPGQGQKQQHPDQDDFENKILNGIFEQEKQMELRAAEAAQNQEMERRLFESDLTKKQKRKRRTRQEIDQEIKRKQDAK